MNKLKRRFYTLLPVIVGMAIASCNNNSTDVDSPPQTDNIQPEVRPLKISKAEKLNPDSIKTAALHPLVKPIDIKKIRNQSYGAIDFQPFKYPVEKATFDYKTLPEKDLDIDKLPSRPLKFITEKLPPPKRLKSGSLRLKDTVLSLYQMDLGFGDQPEFVLTGHDGFLWLAIHGGIYRYDGENLLQYTNQSNDFIYSLFQDNSGNIWFNSNIGWLGVLDVKNGLLKKTNAAKGLSTYNEVRMFQDDQQRIWVTFWPGGINIIDPELQTVKWLDKKDGLSGSMTTGISQDIHKNIWIGTVGNGVEIIDLKNKKIKYLDKSNGLKIDTVAAVYGDRDGKVWIASFTNGKVASVSIEKGTIEHIKETQSPKTAIWSIAQDNKSRIWFATNNNGVVALDPEKRMVMHLNKNVGLASDNASLCIGKQGEVWIGNTNSLTMLNNNKAVMDHSGTFMAWTSAVDQQGLIWVNNFLSGINIIDRQAKSFKNINTSHGLSNDTINTIRAVGSKIFVSYTYNGLDIIDPEKATLTHISKDQGFRNSSAVAYADDQTGKIWIGGIPNQVDVLDLVNNTIKHIHLTKTKETGDINIIVIKRDLEGRMWLSYPGGICIIDPKTLMVQYLNDIANFKEPFIKFLDADNKGNMWVGTHQLDWTSPKPGSVYMLDIAKLELTSFSKTPGLNNHIINSILQHQNNIYVGTNDGVTSLMPSQNSDTGGKKWEVHSFGKNDGIKRIHQFNGLPDAISADGLYMFADAGVSVLDMSKPTPAISQPYIAAITILDQPKYFTGSKVSDSTGITWDRVTAPNNIPAELNLTYDQNYLRFEYTTVNLAEHDTTWYRYQLAGVDKNWSAKTVSTVSRNYFNVPPGKYTFAVISKSGDNIWSKPAIFSLVISPPWWLAWWAYVCYVLLFFGVLWCFVTYRSYQLVKEKRVLEHKVYVRTEEVMQQKEEIETQRDNLEKAFQELKITQTQLVQSEKMASLGELTAGIAHEIQNPLNFVNNFSEVSIELLAELQQEAKAGHNTEVIAIAGDISQNLEKINHHGKRADSIVKSMLEHSRSASRQKESTNINQLADEYMRLSYHGLRAKDKSFNAQLLTQLDPDLPKVNAIGQEIGRVLLNLFNNAFYAVNQKSKTAGPDYKPEVSVSTAFANGQVLITVKDNGVGIPDAIKEKIMQPFFTTKPTGEGTGLGLSLSYDIVVKGHGGKIEIDTKEGEYTEFKVYLPV